MIPLYFPEVSNQDKNVQFKKTSKMICGSIRDFYFKCLGNDEEKPFQPFYDFLEKRIGIQADICKSYFEKFLKKIRGN